MGLCFAPNGTLYVADFRGHRIRKIADGQVTTVAGNGTLGYAAGGNALETAIGFPSSIIALTDDDIYFINSYTYGIVKLSGGVLSTVAGDGTPGSSGDGGPAKDAQVNAPAGLAAGPDGSLYFTELTLLGIVRKIDAAGNISTIAGGLNYHDFITVDAAGTVYVADFGIQRIAMIRNGVVSTVAGGTYGSALNQLSIPSGVAVGPDGGLYIADSGNDRIMRY
jgi:sugar lactone lactonase YvrE